MVLVKILKRRDAASVIIAILIAMILVQPLNSLTSTPAAKLLSLNNGQYYGSAPPNSGWKYYVYLVVWAIFQIVLLEILCWLVVLANRPINRKK